MGTTIGISVVIPFHDNGNEALGAAMAVLRQDLPSGSVLDVVLVDDGSRVATATFVTKHADSRIRTVRLESNAGRAAARNIGAEVATADMLLFLDADCAPADRSWLSKLLAAFDGHDVVAAGGPLFSTGKGFWAHYQSDVRNRRITGHSNAIPALTTANLMVRRGAFEKIDGFDERYRGYGFEDRDLLLRLAGNGVLALVTDAPVTHRDAVRLSDVARKLQEAGATTSAVFGTDHPQAYRALGYAAIDCSMHPWMRPVAAIFGPLAMAAAPLFDRWLDRLPYPIGKGLVKIISALAFLYGTSRRRRSA